jgi:hypothetical protein
MGTARAALETLAWADLTLYHSWRRIAENRFCQMIRIHSVLQPSAERRAQCDLKSFGSRLRVGLYGVGDAVTVRVLCIAPPEPLVRICVDFVVVCVGWVVVAVDPCC